MGLLNAIVYGMQFLFITTLPIYLGELRFTSLQIGVLTALGFAVTVAAQGLWGMVSDRAKHKNRVVMWLILGSVLSSITLFFQRLHTFGLLLLVISALYFFMKPILSMTEAMALDAQERGLADYGRVRAAGSVGYGLIGLILAALAGLPVTVAFAAFTVAMVFSFFPLKFCPILPGKQRKTDRRHIGALLKNRQLLPVLFFGFFLYWLLNYRMTFFPVYFTHVLGYPKWLVTLYTALSMLLQVPMLMHARRWFKRSNLYRLMLLAALLLLAGYGASVLTTHIVWLALVTLFHSTAAALISYTGAVFVNAVVPEEQVSTGQGLWAAVTGGLGPVAGSLIGGLVGSLAGGIWQSFVFSLALSAAVLVVFALVFRGKELRLDQG